MEIINNNRAKIEYYNSLLENLEEELIDLKVEKNKIKRAFIKNQNRISNGHVFFIVSGIVLIGFVASLFILITNIIEILPIAAVSALIIVRMINQTFNDFYHINYCNNKIENNVNEFKIYEKEEKKKEIENILVIRNLLNNILENNHIFNFEKEELLAKILSDSDKSLDDFNIDELNTITFYLQKLEIENYSYDVGASFFKNSNMEKLEEKGYQKTLK